MYNCILICKSLTYAQRTAKLLEGHGCLTVISKPPRELTSNSCGYGIKIRRACSGLALDLIRRYNLPPVRMFLIEGDRYIEVES